MTVSSPLATLLTDAASAGKNSANTATPPSNGLFADLLSAHSGKPIALAADSSAQVRGHTGGKPLPLYVAGESGDNSPGNRLSATNQNELASLATANGSAVSLPAIDIETDGWLEALSKRLQDMATKGLSQADIPIDAHQPEQLTARLASGTDSTDILLEATSPELAQLIQQALPELGERLAAGLSQASHTPSSWPDSLAKGVQSLLDQGGGQTTLALPSQALSQLRVTSADNGGKPQIELSVPSAKDQKAVMALLTPGQTGAAAVRVPGAESLNAMTVKHDPDLAMPASTNHVSLAGSRSSTDQLAAQPGMASNSAITDNDSYARANQSQPPVNIALSITSKQPIENGAVSPQWSHSHSSLANATKAAATVTATTQAMALGTRYTTHTTRADSRGTEAPAAMPMSQATAGTARATENSATAGMAQYSIGSGNEQNRSALMADKSSGPSIAGQAELLRHSDTASAGQTAETKPDLSSITSTSQSPASQGGSTHTNTLPATRLPAMPMSPGEPGWTETLSERVRMSAGLSSQKAQLQLKPPELGNVDIKVQMEGDRAHISFTAASATARDALETTLPRLRELLTGQGLNLGNVDISSGQQQQSGHQQNGHPGSATSAGDPDRAGESVETEEDQLTSEAARTATSDLNSRVDAFA